MSALYGAEFALRLRDYARDFGIKNPRLAIAGFNPHAGESGNLGREEIDIFIPAIASIADGKDLTSSVPYPPTQCSMQKPDKISMQRFAPIMIRH